MYKRLVVAALLLMPARPAPAQAPMSDSAQVLYRRLQSLLPEYNAARKAFMSYDSIERARRLRRDIEPLDTARFGPLLVVAADRQSSKAFSLMREAYNARSPMFAGLETRPAVTVLMEIGSPVPVFQELSRAHRARAVWVPRARRDKQVEIVGRLIDESIGSFLSDSLMAWLGDGLTYGSSYREVYWQLATSDVASVRSCYRGDGNSCADALGTIPHDPFEWYSPQQIRRIVLSQNGWRLTPQLYACRGSKNRVWEVPAAKADTAACIEYARDYIRIPPPLSNIARGNFFLFLLQRAGSGSVLRASEGGDSFAAVASALAGGDVAHAAAEWRAQVDEAAHQGRRSLAAVSAAGLFWVLVMLGLSFRSTRRRFG